MTTERPPATPTQSDREPSGAADLESTVLKVEKRRPPPLPARPAAPAVPKVIKSAALDPLPVELEDLEGQVPPGRYSARNISESVVAPTRASRPVLVNPNAQSLAAVAPVRSPALGKPSALTPATPPLSARAVVPSTPLGSPQVPEAKGPPAVEPVQVSPPASSTEAAESSPVRATMEAPDPAAKAKRPEQPAPDWLDELFAVGDGDGNEDRFELDEADGAVDLLAAARVEAGWDATLASSPSRFGSHVASVEASSGSELGRAETIERGLCAFWLANRCFALDVGLVGEVVTVDAVVTVPLGPPALLGLFNLRGTPVALVDLTRVLELDQPPPTEPGPDRGLLALVLRSGELVVAALIDKMEAVLPPGRETLIRPEASDPGITQGFIEARHRAGLVVTVLEPRAVLERLERLKYV